MSQGLTLDTGALVALERRHARAVWLLRGALQRRHRVTVPSAVVAEWWRGRTDVRDDIRRSVWIEPLDEELARSAGEAIGTVRGATVVDAIVVASAARRGDVVLTSDVSDLARLCDHFRSVRIVGL